MQWIIVLTFSYNQSWIEEKQKFGKLWQFVILVKSASTLFFIECGIGCKNDRNDPSEEKCYVSIADILLDLHHGYECLKRFSLSAA